jgi:outer membrane usher protein
MSKVNAITWWYFLTLLLFAGSYTASLAADLPAPSKVAQMQDSMLYLELVLNGKSAGEVVPVNYTQGHFYVARGLLQRLGLNIPGQAQEMIAVDSVVTVNYDSVAQKLLLTAPADQLPMQYIQAARLVTPVTAASELGMLFNYDTYINRPQQKEGRYVSLASELRVFGQFGSVSNTGVYKHNLGGASHGMKESYLRYDTQWRYSDETRLLTYHAGDITTGALPWSSSVRLGGVQISRNFTLRPDLVTYPLPQFAGQAAVPSVVDLYINTYKTSTTQINPGPFTLENMPFINGRGQATVVVTDAQGKTVSTTLPFYVTSQLLKKGLFDYSASVGALRHDYGIQSFSYKKAAGSGILRYGVFDFLTVEAQAEGTHGLSVAGAGIGARLGMLGVVNIAARQSNANKAALSGGLSQSLAAKGEQSVFGYSYGTSYFSVSAQRALNSPHFMDLGGGGNAGRSQRRADIFSTSVNLGAIGSVGTGYFLKQTADSNRTRLVNVSYSNVFWKNVNLYATVNRAIGMKGYNAQLQVVMPFDKTSSMSASASRDAKRQMSQQLTYNRSVPSDGGVGASLVYKHTHPSYQQANLLWRNAHLQLQSGLYGTKGNRTAWGAVSGAIVMMDGSLHTANEINDAFALVATDYPKVPVYYENQLIGQTNRKGHVLVPNVSAYYASKFAIDTLQLPADVRTPVVEKKVAVRERSGVVVRLPVQKIYAASMVLQTPQGQFLPRGSLVKLQGVDYQTYVGWNGMVYIENLSKNNQLTVISSDLEICQVNFTADLTAPMPLQFTKPLSCVPLAETSSIAVEAS